MTCPECCAEVDSLGWIWGTQCCAECIEEIEEQEEYFCMTEED